MLYNGNVENKQQRKNIMLKCELEKAINESNFCKQCYQKDYAFDAVVNGRKFEIRPARLSGYQSGVVAYSYETGTTEEFDFINIAS